MDMNCPECYRYSVGGYLCKRCINETMDSIKEEYNEWLQGIGVLPFEENSNG